MRAEPPRLHDSVSLEKTCHRVHWVDLRGAVSLLRGLKMAAPSARPACEVENLMCLPVTDEEWEATRDEATRTRQQSG